VQMNAMLMIGDLNSVESPPTPLPEALNVMIAAVDDGKLSDAIRVAALIGIQRHATAGIADEEVRKTLTNTLIKLVSSGLPAGADGLGHQWMFGQAFEILGTLGFVGENNSVYNAMLKALADNKLSLRTRRVAAESLGQLKYAGVAGIDPIEAAAAIGQYAIDVCSEALRLPKETDKNFIRRLMKQQLTASLTALIGGEDPARKGIASLAREPAQQSFLNELQKNIKDMIDLVDDKKREKDELQGPIRDLLQKLEAWLKKKPQ
jgi:hypothetical protein